MSMLLEGKKVIATGASGDLGFAMAKAFVENGAVVASLGRSEKTDEYAKKLSDQCFGISVDVSDRGALSKAFEEAYNRLGGVDVLLNCAGVNTRCPAKDYEAEVWDKIIEVNLSAAFFLCQLAGRHMIEQGSGKIINICSMTSFTGGLNNVAYVASKGALAQMTKTLSNEWAKYGICVNGIAPGYMWTKMNIEYYTNGKGSEIREKIREHIPVGRWGNPEDLKGPAVFLASSASDYITGHILPVDGGYLSCN